MFMLKRKIATDKSLLKNTKFNFLLLRYCAKSTLPRYFKIYILDRKNV